MIVSVSVCKLSLLFDRVKIRNEKYTQRSIFCGTNSLNFDELILFLAYSSPSRKAPTYAYSPFGRTMVSCEGDVYYSTILNRRIFDDKTFTNKTELQKTAGIWTTRRRCQSISTNRFDRSLWRVRFSTLRFKKKVQIRFKGNMKRCKFASL